jgi:hypothetical protein
MQGGVEKRLDIRAAEEQHPPLGIMGGVQERAW